MVSRRGHLGCPAWPNCDEYPAGCLHHTDDPEPVGQRDPVPFGTDDMVIRATERYGAFVVLDPRVLWGSPEGGIASLHVAEQSRCGLEGPSEPWPRASARL